MERKSQLEELIDKHSKTKPAQEAGASLARAYSELFSNQEKIVKDNKPLSEIEENLKRFIDEKLNDKAESQKKTTNIVLFIAVIRAMIAHEKIFAIHQAFWKKQLMELAMMLRGRKKGRGDDEDFSDRLTAVQAFGLNDRMLQIEAQIREVFDRINKHRDQIFDKYNLSPEARKIVIAADKKFQDLATPLLKTMMLETNHPDVRHAASKQLMVHEKDRNNYLRGNLKEPDEIQAMKEHEANRCQNLISLLLSQPHTQIGIDKNTAVNASAIPKAIERVEEFEQAVDQFFNKRKKSKLQHPDERKKNEPQNLNIVPNGSPKVSENPSSMPELNNRVKPRP